MREIDKKKLEAELLRVQAGRADMELKVLESYEQIDRLNAGIENQKKRERELIEMLAQAGD